MSVKVHLSWSDPIVRELQVQFDNGATEVILEDMGFAPSLEVINLFALSGYSLTTKQGDYERISEWVFTSIAI